MMQDYYGPYDPFDPSRRSRDAQPSPDGSPAPHEENYDDLVWMSFGDAPVVPPLEADPEPTSERYEDQRLPTESWSPPEFAAAPAAGTSPIGEGARTHERCDMTVLPSGNIPYYTNDRPRHAHGAASKKRSMLPMLALCLCFTLIGGALGGLTVLGFSTSPEAEQPAAATPPVHVETVPESADGGDAKAIVYQSGVTLTPAQIFEKCNQGVVAISTETTTQNIFGQASTMPASGSGFVASSDGYIVTNNHVIDGASSIEVLLADGDTYPAQVVGRDATNDLAVLKIDVQGLTALDWGSSSALTVGSPVVAIGNPLGELANSETSGIVSALDRAVNIDGTPLTMLQIDASVSPGNSGGPLLNDQGEVVGVVSAKSSGSGVEGIGFAIPSDIARGIVEQLIEHGYVTGRPYLGITPQDVDAAMSRYYNLPTGIYVVSVDPGSCAEKAGLQTGDVITAFGGVAVSTRAELIGQKNTYMAGDTVEITVVRAGQPLNLSVTLDEALPEDDQPVQQQEMLPPWAQQPYDEDM